MSPARPRLTPLEGRATPAVTGLSGEVATPPADPMDNPPPAQPKPAPAPTPTRSPTWPSDPERGDAGPLQLGFDAV